MTTAETAKSLAAKEARKTVDTLWAAGLLYRRPSTDAEALAIIQAALESSSESLTGLKEGVEYILHEIDVERILSESHTRVLKTANMTNADFAQVAYTAALETATEIITKHFPAKLIEEREQAAPLRKPFEAIADRSEETRQMLRDMGLKEVEPHFWEFSKTPTYREAFEKAAAKRAERETE